MKVVKRFLINLMKTILGIDISSSCIGFGVLRLDAGNINIIEHGNIKPPKKEEFPIVQRLNLTCNEIKTLCNRVNPDIVVIEDIIQFMAGGSSANTIITLGIFNRIIATEIYRLTQKLPIFLLPQTIRAKIKKFLQKTIKIEKEDGPDILKEVFGDEFTIQYKQKGKNKGKPIQTTYDEADALLAAFAGIIKEYGQHTCNEMKVTHMGFNNKQQECIECINKKPKFEDTEKQLLMAAKQSAKELDLEFSLKAKNITIPDKCPILDIDLSKDNTIKDDSPVLDRINDLEGYIPRNIQIISRRASRLKNNVTFEELEKIINYIKKS